MNSVRTTRTRLSLFMHLFLFLCLTAAIPLTTARAEDSCAPAFNMSTDILSQYIFRGAANSDASAVIQPSFTASWNGFSANVWGNLDTARHTDNSFLQFNGPQAGQTHWSETDVTVNYTYNITKEFSVLVGNVYYGLQTPLKSAYNQDEDELFGGVSYNLPWFTVAFTTYGEVIHSVDEWFELDLSKSIDMPMLDCVCKGSTLNLGASFAYLILNHDNNLLNYHNGGQFGSYSNFHTCLLNAALTFPFSKIWSVSPKVGLWLPLTGAAEDYLQANSLDQKSIHFYGGVNVTATF